MTKSTLLSRQDIYLLFKDGLCKMYLSDYYKDTYYRKGTSCVRRRQLYDRQGTFLWERWVDVYGKSIHKPQVKKVLLQYKFTRYHLGPSRTKLDILEIEERIFVVLTRIDCLFLGEDLARPLVGKVQLLTSKIKLEPTYVFSSDPFSGSVS